MCRVVACFGARRRQLRKVWPTWQNLLYAIHCAWIIVLNLISTVMGPGGLMLGMIRHTYVFIEAPHPSALGSGICEARPFLEGLPS
jgi:hypothetical protein